VARRSALRDGEALSFIPAKLNRREPAAGNYNAALRLTRTLASFSQTALATCHRLPTDAPFNPREDLVREFPSRVFPRPTSPSPRAYPFREYRFERDSEWES